MSWKRWIRIGSLFVLPVATSQYASAGWDTRVVDPNEFHYVSDVHLLAQVTITLNADHFLAKGFAIGNILANSFATETCEEREKVEYTWIPDEHCQTGHFAYEACVEIRGNYLAAETPASIGFHGTVEARCDAVGVHATADATANASFSDGAGGSAGVSIGAHGAGTAGATIPTQTSGTGGGSDISANDDDDGGPLCVAQATVERHCYAHLTLFAGNGLFYPGEIKAKAHGKLTDDVHLGDGCCDDEGETQH